MSTSETSAPQPKGHPIGFRFFFWGEFAERFSFYGMRAILALYMVDELGISKANASLYQSLFLAAVYFTPLIGGFIADNFFGKYWTIVGFSLPYLIGQFLVGFPNNYVFVGSLALLAMGSGVIKPNISSLMGMTYDQQRPGQDTLRSAAFSWFYFAVNTGAFLSQIILPYMRDHHGYRVAFLTPFAFMALALTIFALGKKYYALETGERKVATSEETADKWKVLGLVVLLFAPCCFFWAIFDQSSFTWVYFTDTYSNTVIHLPILGEVPFSSDGLQFFNSLFILIFVPISIWFWKFLDRRGIKIKATTKLFTGFMLTALCMLIMAGAGFQAGEMKETLRISTPFADFILPAESFKLDGADLPMDKNKTVTFEDDKKFASGSLQEGDFNLHFGEGKIVKKKVNFQDGTLETPAGTLVFANGLIDIEKSTLLYNAQDKKIINAVNPPKSVISMIPKPDYVKETLAKFESGAPKAETGETKSDAKITISNFEYVPKEQQVTVWWQIFAYLILTFAEILVSITGLELAFVIAPDSMKSLITGCWLATVGVANLAINAPITGYYPEMRPGVYFTMLTIMMLVVAFAFLFIVKFVNKEMAARDASKGKK
ncbi:oligopeptide:H+ symporter [Telmatocola sphagniphila]|uniref:Oligopeptide:H+ symporter n=1 Tax=Telmatocola sphagniphila TaxID=1123043 RepID=A0A8E6EV90_9BACT|nr:oligopeptide:H+ symporter [Telmatocola sphagniphila]QVL32287.1 oligopeptide:H+ symporter [Telmatocola sphagniphila]